METPNICARMCCFDARALSLLDLVALASTWHPGPFRQLPIPLALLFEHECPLASHALNATDSVILVCIGSFISAFVLCLLVWHRRFLFSFLRRTPSGRATWASFSAHTASWLDFPQYITLTVLTGICAMLYCRHNSAGSITHNPNHH